MAAECMKCAFGLDRSVMKDELSSAPELVPLAHFYHAPAEGVAMGPAAFAENIPEDVQRPFRRARSGDVLERFLYIVVPYPHVHIRPFAFDSIVPDVGDYVAVDVRVAVGTSLEAEIGPAADGVVVAVVFRRANLVIANDVSA